MVGSTEQTVDSVPNRFWVLLALIYGVQIKFSLTFSINFYNKISQFSKKFLEIGIITLRRKIDLTIVKFHGCCGRTLSPCVKKLKF